MRQTLLVATAAVAAAALATTGGAAARSGHAPIFVRLSLTVSGSASGVHLEGQTNLPDGTMLMLDVAEKAYTKLAPYADARGYYYADGRAFARSGRFRSRTFTYGGSRFPAGQYRAEVIMPFAGIEPAEVKAIIGWKGENLRGPLVKSAGGAGSVRMVEAPPTWFTIR